MHGEFKVPGGKLVVVDLDVIDGRIANFRLAGDISDELGFAAGRFILDVVDATATVTPGGSGATPVTVQELSAAYLGAVPPTTPELGLLRTARAPYLSVWY